MVAETKGRRCDQARLHTRLAAPGDHGIEVGDEDGVEMNGFEGM